MDPYYPFEALDVWEHKRLIVPDARSFITPDFPVDFWEAPVFTMPPETAQEQLLVLRAQRLAAAAALENAAREAAQLPLEIDRHLNPLRQQLHEVTGALEALETAAAVAEEADAAMEIEACGAHPSSASGGQSPTAGAPAELEVQIVRNDPPLRYDTNLPVDLLSMVYAGRGAGNSTGVVFGTWYRTIQERTIADFPLTTRSADFRDGRMSKTFMAALVLSLQSCGRLYVGQRHYSAFECAVLCLYLLHRARGSADSQAPSTFLGLVGQLPRYLASMAAAIGDEGGRPHYRFREDKLPKAQFAATGGRYDRGALLPHVVVATLMRHGVLPAAPGDVPKDAVGGIDPDNQAHQDDVNRAAAAFLSRGQNLFLWEDQTLLRATANTITCLLVIQRLLLNGNVYADRLNNRLQLGMLIPGAVPSEAIAKGASGSDSGAVKSGDNNLEALCRHYLDPLYQADPKVELTQLFPGLAALCLDAQAGRTTASTRRVVDMSAGSRQAALVRLTALELINRTRANTTPVGEVISAHDALALQFEQGLGLLAQQARIGPSTNAKRFGAFNVNSDYDLLYFLCLGFIPQFLSAA
ncbi:DNA packaging tegument protein UL25 [Pteropodid alphaherpesvirus 1]|uniref:DNA packaging tegument protein UL25 n=1 Tax=Pteropodid alphaherpesvirus 1 TaxID=1343901 RepID=A0A060Q0V3_9ALPH|nr:DNA packaging tegument protein UL25 [Pteropodid alphaherpesvirus 1]BAP00704.1 DNA packaging tegument protein UL25 [Pteropodid alphaherpesvirus 1]